MKKRIVPHLVAAALLLPFFTAAAEDPGDRNDTIEQKLDEIVIPSLVLSSIHLPGAMEMLSEMSKEHDPAGVGVSIATRTPRRTNSFPRVNLAVRGLPLRNVLRLATEDIGYSFKVQDGAVILYESDDRYNLDFSEPRTRIFSLRELSAFFTNDDITAALEIAWELGGHSPDDVTVRIHDETSLLYVRGSQSAIGEAEMVMRHLDQTRQLMGDTDRQDQLRQAAEELRHRRALRQQ